MFYCNTKKKNKKKYLQIEIINLTKSRNTTICIMYYNGLKLDG